MSDFNKYQEFVKGMKRYPEQYAILYPALGLCGESGEIAEKIKKWLRDEGGPKVMSWTDATVPPAAKGMSESRRDAILSELGDPLWYIAALADDMGFTLQEVVDANVAKLTSRKERGVLGGSGDNR